MAVRWSDNDGKPYCPKCGCLDLYTYKARKIWKCKGCTHQFSATSGTIFASHKLPIRDYLMTIALFVNGAKGMSVLQLSRDLNVQYKTAFVLAHKLREAVAALRNDRTMSGEVEIDGAYFGSYVKPRNHKENRRDVAALNIRLTSAALSSSCASATACRCRSVLGSRHPDF